MNKIIIKKYLFFLTGIAIGAISFNLFFLSNNIAAFGVSGLSIVIKKAFNIDPSLFIFIANIILLILSYFLLGLKTTKKTILGSLLFPVFVKLTAFVPEVINIKDAELILIAIFGGLTNGIGSGLILREGFTTGGTDILNQIVNKYLKVPMGTAIIMVDGCVVLAGGFVFGIERMIYSVLVLLILSNISNKIIVGINNTKTMFIITKKYRQVSDYLLKELNNGLSTIDVEGGYDKGKRKMIMVAIKNKDYYRAKEAINIIDKEAFITITESYEILKHFPLVSKQG